MWRRSLREHSVQIGSRERAMSIRMIVTDLDGTFLNSKEELPAGSADIVRQCKEKGILFVIATARSAASARKIADVLEPDAIITSGGAGAVCGDQVIYDAVFSEKEAERMISKCARDEKTAYVRVIGEKCDLTSNPAVRAWELEYGHYQKTDFYEIPKQKVSKITICCSDPKYIKTMFEEEENCCVITSYSGQDQHKLSHAKATKEDALTEVARYFGVDFSEIMAFGDDTSDVNMLRLCGVGVAVGNAREHVKEVADCVCGSNDELGVIRYLEKKLEEW